MQAAFRSHWPAALFDSAARLGEQSVIHVGAFPNITHPQAMVGKSNGWFDKAMGPQREDRVEEFQCRALGD